MKNTKIIRVGDRVRIVTPKVVVRVGYPKTVEDYLDQAESGYGIQLRKSMSWRCAENALREIAYGLAKEDGFGGRERSLHFKEQPGLLGMSFTVSGIRTVKTGTYYPPQYSTSYYGESDWEPGGLSNMKTHRLVTGFGWTTFAGRSLSGEIPVEHLEKVA